MLKLNLVSEELKKEIELRHIYDMVKRIIVIFLIFAIFVSIIVVLARVALGSYYGSVIASQDDTLNSRYSEEVSLLNKKINSAHEIQENKFYVYENLKNILESANEGINIKSAKLGADEETVLVSGIAADRGSLSGFEEEIKNIDSFSKVNLEAVNIFKKEDISFSMEIELK